MRPRARESAKYYVVSVLLLPIALVLNILRFFGYK